MRHKKTLSLANLMAVLATLCTIPTPLLLPLLMDEVLFGKGDGALYFMGRLLPADWQVAFGYIDLVLAVTLLPRGAALVFSMLQVKPFARLSEGIVYRIRLCPIERFRHIALGECETLGGGSISAHLVTDLDTLDGFIGEALSHFLVTLLTLLGTVAILVWMHWQLVLLILLFNPLVIWSTVQLGKYIKYLKKLESDSTARFIQALTETLEAIREVRVGSRQGYFPGRLGYRVQEAHDYAVASQWRSDAAGRTSGLLFQFSIDVLRTAVILTVLLSDLSIGQMLTIFNCLWFMVGPVEQLLGLQYAYYTAGGVLQRINELLARADGPHYPPLHDPLAGRMTIGIEVRGLDFICGEDKVPERLDLNIGAGEEATLIGTSGGDESTLVQLLLGLYSAQCGGIHYGGMSLEEIDLDHVCEHIAVVLQRPVLFNDSVRANPAMGRERSDQACRRALKIVRSADGVRRLPQGLSAVVGRSGMRLSDGQRQRLATARIVLAELKVVILGETISALDAATEHALHQALDDFLEGRTTLIVARRLSAVKQADRVLISGDGHIAESGDYQQLTAEDDSCVRLYGYLQRT